MLIAGCHLKLLFFIYTYVGVSVQYRVVQAYVSFLCISVMLVCNDRTAYVFHRIASLISAQDGPL